MKLTTHSIIALTLIALVAFQEDSYALSKATPDRDHVIRESGQIVVGLVAEMRTETTSTGALETIYTVTVSEVLKGDSLSSVEIRLPGGNSSITRNGIQVKVEEFIVGAPQLAIGQPIIAALKFDARTGGLAPTRFGQSIFAPNASQGNAEAIVDQLISKNVRLTEAEFENALKHFGADSDISLPPSNVESGPAQKQRTISRVAPAAQFEISSKPPPSHYRPVTISLDTRPANLTDATVVNKENVTEWGYQAIEYWNSYATAFTVHESHWSGTFPDYTSQFHGLVTDTEYRQKTGSNWPDASTDGITHVRLLHEPHFDFSCLCQRTLTYWEADAFIRDVFDKPDRAQQVILHELGHVLGLDHDWDELSVMNYIDADWRRPILYADDVRALRALNGARIIDQTDYAIRLYNLSEPYQAEPGRDAQISHASIGGDMGIAFGTVPFLFNRHEPIPLRNYIIENLGTTVDEDIVVQWRLKSIDGSTSDYLLGDVLMPSQPVDAQGMSTIYNDGWLKLPAPIGIVAGLYELEAEIISPANDGRTENNIARHELLVAYIDECTDSNEPNNSDTQATYLGESSVGSTLYAVGRTCTESDEDWFSFDVPEGASAKIEFQGLDSVNQTLEVFDPQFAAEVRNELGNKSVAYAAAVPGRYHVRVRGGGIGVTRYHGRAPYTVSVTSAPATQTITLTPSPLPPMNTLEGVRPDPHQIYLSTPGDEPVQFSLSADVDWVTFEPSEGMVLPNASQAVSVIFNEAYVDLPWGNFGYWMTLHNQSTNIDQELFQYVQITQNCVNDQYDGQFPTVSDGSTLERRFCRTLEFDSQTLQIDEPSELRVTYRPKGLSDDQFDEFRQYFLANEVGTRDYPPKVGDNESYIEAVFACDTEFEVPAGEFRVHQRLHDYFYSDVDWPIDYDVEFRVTACTDLDDSDGDGVANAQDAFPLDASESVDTDQDSIGNNTDMDDDGDGVPDADDAFPLDNTEWSDSDGDGVGDNADDFPFNATQVSDGDGDGIADSADNCRHVNNADQLNTDGDTEGDACDVDDDSDGIVDEYDNCPQVSNLEQSDADGNGIGDACTIQAYSIRKTTITGKTQQKSPW